MSLENPSLDDKSFTRIVEEARALIPRYAPEWTDHNVHDPGITFLELFAWLAEILHYRANQITDANYDKFFALSGIARSGSQFAEVAVDFDKSVAQTSESILIPANTVVIPDGRDDLPFATERDTYLTPAILKKVLLDRDGRTIDRTAANRERAGHFILFQKPEEVLRVGLSPASTAPELRLTITLYEVGLPPRQPLVGEAANFEPSASLQWEYLVGSGWEELEVLEDATLHLSRSGDITFRRPDKMGEKDECHWIRAKLKDGYYEIPPHIFTISVNTLRARQVETVVNEDLGLGKGTPDQVVRLKKYPVVVNPEVSADRFQVGEVLDWQALVMRLPEPAKTKGQGPGGTDNSKERYIVKQLVSLDLIGPQMRKILNRQRFRKRKHRKFSKPADSEKHTLARGFELLLNQVNFYDRRIFSGVEIPQEYRALAERDEVACTNTTLLRKFNRFLLRSIFPDLVVSDRLELQVGHPVTHVEAEPKSWERWQEVADFCNSAPNDRHFVFDPETGEILFGNGLNGRIPQSSERIRARFYRTTREEKGNIQDGLSWSLLEPAKAKSLKGKNWDPASGGKKRESVDEAKLRVLGEFSRSYRALTAQDYEKIALATPGLRVARAKAIPNCNLEILPRQSFPGHVTIVVLPYSLVLEGADPTRVGPSEGFLRTVRSYLGSHRMLGTTLHVVGPKFEPVTVRCRVFLKKGVSDTAARKHVEEALKKFLDPIDGGEEKRKGWPFGRSVFPSEIHQLLSTLADVDYITDLSLNGLGKDTSVKLPVHGLPVSGQHHLQLISFDDRPGRQGRQSQGASTRE
ncbi:MAG: putative baseplate assembly protein [Candidatus Binatia bacterium]